MSFLASSCLSMCDISLQGWLELKTQSKKSLKKSTQLFWDKKMQKQWHKLRDVINLIMMSLRPEANGHIYCHKPEKNFIPSEAKANPRQ